MLLVPLPQDVPGYLGKNLRLVWTCLYAFWRRFSKISEETEDQKENETTEESHMQLASKDQFIQLRKLINNVQDIEELLFFQPSGYTDTMGEYFHVQNTSEFLQKLYYVHIYKVLNLRRSLYLYR